MTFSMKPDGFQFGRAGLGETVRVRAADLDRCVALGRRSTALSQRRKPYLPSSSPIAVGRQFLPPSHRNIEPPSDPAIAAEGDAAQGSGAPA